MSDADTRDSDRRPDVQALIDRARDTAGTVKDMSIDAAHTVRARVTDFVGTNETKIDNVIDRTGGFVDEKLTRHRFSDKIDRAQGALKDVVGKVGDTGKSESRPES